MTVLRREVKQSSIANPGRGPCRIVSPPILAIVPLILRRLRGPSPASVTKPSAILRSIGLIHRRRLALQRGPEKARELSGDRDGDLRWRLMLSRQFPETAAQPLLRLLSNGNHARRLPFASARESGPDTRAMLVVP